MIGLPMTFFKAEPDPDIPEMLTLTVRFFENIEAQRRNEETEIPLAISAEIALLMAEQIVNAVQLSRMSPTSSDNVN